MLNIFFAVLKNHILEIIWVNIFLAKRVSKEIHIYICRFISDPFIDGLRTELHELESKKQEAIDKAIAEKTAKGKK